MIIIHYGDISAARIKGHTKLLGQDVIIAHKLLKNSIDELNYILLSDKYLSKIKDKTKLKFWFNWEELRTGKEVYDYIGEVSYHYITLDEMEYMEDIPFVSLLKTNKKAT